MIEKHTWLPLRMTPWKQVLHLHTAKAGPDFGQYIFGSRQLQFYTMQLHFIEITLHRPFMLTHNPWKKTLLTIDVSCLDLCLHLV